MPTLTAALGALERHCGFPQSRSRSIARRLQEHGMLPLGAPGVAPAIEAGGFIRLFVALAADTTVHEAPTAVRERLNCTPGGASLVGAPTSISTAEGYLLALVETALDAPADLAHMDIEVVANFPEVAVHWGDGTVGRFQPVGSLVGFWQTSMHRRSTTVPGAAFRDAARATLQGSK